MSELIKPEILPGRTFDQYLAAIANCPDDYVNSRNSERIISRFTAELGIYDNFLVFLGGDFFDLRKALRSLRKYRLFRSEISPNGEAKTDIFLYRPGTVILTVYDPIKLGLARGRASHFYLCDRELFLRRLEEDFKISILLNVYQEKKVREISAEKALGFTIMDIGRIAQAKGIPLCFTDATGWNNPSDVLEPVYYGLRTSEITHPPSVLA